MSRPFGKARGGFVPPVTLPTPTPTPAVGFVSTTVLGGETPISFAAFAAAFLANTLTNGTTYRVAMGGQAQIIDLPSLPFVCTANNIVVIPDIRGVYTDNPLGEGTGSTYPSKFQRALTLRGFIVFTGNVRMPYTEVVRPPAIWPDWVNLGQTWNDVGVVSNAVGVMPLVGSAGGDVVFDYGRIFSGYGKTAARIDPSISYPDLDSPEPYYDDGTNSGIYSATPTGAYTHQADRGMGVAPLSCRNRRLSDGLMYNAMTQAPPAYGRVTWVAANNRYEPGGSIGSVTVNCGDLDSVTGANGFNLAGLTDGKSVFLNGCTMWGFNSFWLQFGPLGDSALSRVEVNGLLCEGFYNSVLNLGSGHPDLIEAIGNFNGSIKRMKLRSMFFLSTGLTQDQIFGARIQPTYHASGFDTFLDGPQAANCLILGANNGMSFHNARDPYLYGVYTLNPGWANSSVSASGKTTAPATLDAANLGESAFPQPQTAGLIEGCFGEGAAYPISATVKSSRMTNQGDTTQQAIAFGSAATIEPARNAQAAYAAYCLGKPEFPWSKISDALLEFQQAAPYAHLPVHCQPMPAVNVATSSAVASSPVFIHGPDNGSYVGAITGGATVEVRDIDARAGDGNLSAVTGTLIAAASATPTMQTNKKAVFKATAPGTAGLATDYTLTFGPVGKQRSFVWRVITASANRYPTATISNLLLQRSGGMGASAATQFSFATIFKPTALSGAQTLFHTDGASQADFSILMSGTYLVVQYKLNGASDPLFKATFDLSQVISTTAMNGLVVAVDLTKDNEFDGIQVFLNGLRMPPFNGAIWSTGVSIDMSVGVNLFKDATYDQRFGGTVAALYVALGSIAWDINRLSLLQELNPDVAGIGTNIGGKFLLGKQAEIAFAGKATRLNAANNDGSLSTGWSAVGTATQATDATWPL